MYKEIKDLLTELNSENIEELKPKIMRKVNQLILSIYDENISDLELEKMYELIVMREEFREEVRKNSNGALEGIFISNFIKAYEEFIDEIEAGQYIEDGIEIISEALKSIGGRWRGMKLIENGIKDRKYLSSIKYLEDLKSEFYDYLKLHAKRGFNEEQLIVNGLISTIKFDLEEKSQEHGRYIISMLTDHKTKREKSIDEFNEENHLEEVKVKLKREYETELQRRIYSWNKLTSKLQDHYYLENLFKKASMD